MSESAYSDEVAPLLEAVSSVAKHAAAIVRLMNAVEGQGCRPLSEQEYAAVELVVSAVELLAHRAGITSEDRPGRSASLHVQDTGARRDEDPNVLPLDEGDRDPASAGTERRDDVVLDGSNVGAGNHEPFSVDHELMVGHHASPSAGERAEPGLASTVSVEGDEAAGGPNHGAPAATPTNGVTSKNNGAPMSASRGETFCVEVPDPSETSLMARIERSSGLEGYIGVALDLTDDLHEGQHRAALTFIEARNLHAALGAVLAGFTDQS